MSDTFEFSTRPGSAALSVVTIAGLGALAALLWLIAPGYVLLLMVPALVLCLWQMARGPSFGIKMTDAAWHIYAGRENIVVPTEQIAYLRFVDRAAVQRLSVMLHDGTEIQLPRDCMPDPRQLVREATSRGFAVRQAA